jgi:hypothetical protein
MRSRTLMVTAEEKHIIIENVEIRGDSTLALGSLNEKSPVPDEARLQVFPDVVVQKEPKVRGCAVSQAWLCCRPATRRVAVLRQQLMISGKHLHVGGTHRQAPGRRVSETDACCALHT